MFTINMNILSPKNCGINLNSYGTKVKRISHITLIIVLAYCVDC